MLKCQKKSSEEDDSDFIKSPKVTIRQQKRAMWSHERVEIGQERGSGLVQSFPKAMGDGSDEASSSQ